MIPPYFPRGLRVSLPIVLPLDKYEKKKEIPYFVSIAMARSMDTGISFIFILRIL